MSQATIKIIENEDGTLEVSAEFEPSLNLEKMKNVPFSHLLALKAIEAINEAKK